MCARMRMRPRSSSRASAPSACAIPKAGAGGDETSGAAHKEVILSGGTYNSPQLLQLSGIGRRRQCCNRSASSVRHALAGVGEGLQDHFAPRSVARVKNIKTINERARGLNLAVEAFKWATTRRGIA